MQSGEIIDTKYCNDVVTLFVATLKALKTDAYIAKVFRLNQSGEYDIHSLCVVMASEEKNYLVNVGSLEKFWFKRLKIQKNSLQPGVVLPYNWVLWKLAVDQWTMGFNDASQEHIIEEFADIFYAKITQ